jgi:hypothetical protein
MHSFSGLGQCSLSPVINSNEKKGLQQSLTIFLLPGYSLIHLCTEGTNVKNLGNAIE